MRARPGSACSIVAAVTAGHLMKRAEKASNFSLRLADSIKSLARPTASSLTVTATVLPTSSGPTIPANALLRLLRPRSVALVGGKACAEVVRQCRRIGFSGRLWAVHRDLPEIEGVPAVASVAQLPETPDAAFVAVNRHATIEVITALAERGAAGAVCYASGFAEADAAGASLQEQLRLAAGAMPFFGPNCHGFINYLDGAALWPEQHGGVREERGVALITQSGNIALSLSMQRRGLPLAYVLTLGNQACIGLADAIGALLEDPRVTAIGLHIEGIDDPVALDRVARLARLRDVPLVALKAGVSELGTRLARSHTASMAGDDAVADAFFARAGIARVRSLSVLLETLKLLHVHGVLKGREIASMSSSGGEASLIADLATAAGLQFRQLDPRDIESLKSVLPPLATASNPLDYHNFNWGDERSLTAIFSAVTRAGSVITLLVLDFPRADRCVESGYECALRAFIAAGRTTSARLAVVATLADTFPEDRARKLIELGVAPLAGLSDAIAAIAAASRVRGQHGDAAAAQLEQSPARPADTRGRTIPEFEAKRMLAQFGLSIPAGSRVATAAQAVAASEALGYPVALKACGPLIEHKTDLGGVHLGLTDADAVHRAATSVLERIGGELLIERLVSDGIAELIVGVARDPVFGPYLLVGSGGVLAELIGDRRIMLLPASPAEIHAAVGSLRVARLLHGYRGRPAGDLPAVVSAALAIQAFALAHRDSLLELDVNPLIVRPLGHGAVAVDALIRTTEGASP